MDYDVRYLIPRTKAHRCRVHEQQGFVLEGLRDMTTLTKKFNLFVAGASDSGTCIKKI